MDFTPTACEEHSSEDAPPLEDRKTDAPYKNPRCEAVVRGAWVREAGPSPAARARDDTGVGVARRARDTVSALMPHARSEIAVGRVIDPAPSSGYRCRVHGTQPAIDRIVRLGGRSVERRKRSGASSARGLRRTAGRRLAVDRSPRRRQAAAGSGGEGRHGVPFVVRTQYRSGSWGAMGRWTTQPTFSR